MNEDFKGNLKKNIAVITGFVDRMGKDHVGAFAAQASYFILLSFVPFLMLLLTLVRYTALTKELVTDVFLNIVPANSDLQDFVLSIINEVYSKSTAFVPISAVFTLWSAGKGIQALTNGVNAIYHVEETRNYFLMRMRSAAYTLLFIVAILGSLILMVFGNSIQKVLSNYIPVIAKITAYIINMRTSLSIIVLILIFLLIYKLLPNRKASFKSQVPGAVISAVAWALFSLGFSVYLDVFHGFSNMYGSLTTIMLILLWMYFCMYILLIGAEINAYFEERIRALQRKAREKIRMEYQELLHNLKEISQPEEMDEEESGEARQARR